MTVKEVINELSKYPEDIEVELSIKIDLKVTLDHYNRPMTCSMYPKGKVYGVSGTTGNKNEVIISGS